MLSLRLAHGLSFQPLAVRLHHHYRFLGRHVKAAGVMRFENGFTDGATESGMCQSNSGQRRFAFRSNWLIFGIPANSERNRFRSRFRQRKYDIATERNSRNTKVPTGSATLAG